MSRRFQYELELRWASVNRQLEELAAGKTQPGDTDLADLEELLLELREDLREKLSAEFAARHRHGRV